MVEPLDRPSGIQSSQTYWLMADPRIGVRETKMKTVIVSWPSIASVTIAASNIITKPNFPVFTQLLSFRATMLLFALCLCL